MVVLLSACPAGSGSLASRERQPNPTRSTATMTLQQILAFAVIAGTMALFVWGRLRYDLVAGMALLVAVLIGVVPRTRRSRASATTS